jgi:hypothetical protein
MQGLMADVGVGLQVELVLEWVRKVETVVWEMPQGQILVGEGVVAMELMVLQVQMLQEDLVDRAQCTS